MTDERPLTLRQAAQARADLAEIADDIPNLGRGIDA